MQQLKGVAMGSNVALSFACAFMHNFEKRYVYENDIFVKHCVTWWCYIDDIFANWWGDIGTIREFD